MLVALQGGQGVLRREDGQVLLTWDVTGDHGQPLRAGDLYHPVETWLADDRWLVGGLLPPGAVSAEVVDDRDERVHALVGGGAYVAVLEHPSRGRGPAVCCRDASGSPVRRPLPADYPYVAVDDTDVRCPACRAIDWEERVPTEQWRGGRPGPAGTTIPKPIVVCRRCGHEEREGTFFGLGAGCEDEDEAAREARLARGRASARVHRWYSDTMTLRAVTFPLYAADGWQLAIGSSGSKSDRLVSLTINHYDKPDPNPYAGDRARLEITTSNDASSPGSELREARSTLHGWVINSDRESSWPDASRAAITLWLADRRRKAQAEVLAARQSEQPIRIDGTPQRFLMLAAPSGPWVAVRRHEQLTTTITASHVDPTKLALDPLADPAASLLGPEPPSAKDWPW